MLGVVGIVAIAGLAIQATSMIAENIEAREQRKDDTALQNKELDNERKATAEENKVEADRITAISNAQGELAQARDALEKFDRGQTNGTN